MRLQTHWLAIGVVGSVADLVKHELVVGCWLLEGARGQGERREQGERRKWRKVRTSFGLTQVEQNSKLKTSPAYLASPHPSPDRLKRYKRFKHLLADIIHTSLQIVQSFVQACVDDVFDR